MSGWINLPHIGVDCRQIGLIAINNPEQLVRLLKDAGRSG